MAKSDEPVGDDGKGESKHAKPADNYEVGYCKPPAAHRFKPGKSGNPRDRPKGSKGLKAELNAEINEIVTMTTNGQPRRMASRLNDKKRGAFVCVMQRLHQYDLAGMLLERTNGTSYACPRLRPKTRPFRSCATACTNASRAMCFTPNASRLMS